MRKAILAVILAALPAAAWASGPGTTAAPFLKVAMSPRAVAMGGAFGPLADDSGAVFVNPAGLAGSETREVALDFATYLQDARMGNVSYSGVAAGNRFGFGASFLTVGGIERRTNDAVGIVPEAGSFSSSDMAFTFAYAKKDFMAGTINGLNAGLAVKFIRSSIDENNAFAAAVDAGAIYRASEKVNFSLAVQNLGTKMKFEEDSDPLPIDIRAGMLYRPSADLNLVAEVNEYLQDEKFYPSFGAEYWLREALALRGGYKFGYDTENLGAEVGLSLGFGIKVSGLGVDYAYLPFGELGNVHRFGFWLQF